MENIAKGRSVPVRTVQGLSLLAIAAGSHRPHFYAFDVLWLTTNVRSFRSVITFFDMPKTFICRGDALVS